MLLGLPAAPYAAPTPFGGYLDISKARARIDEVAAAYPSTFGGVMLWDAGVADTEKIGDGVTSYGAAIKAHLSTKPCPRSA